MARKSEFEQEALDMENFFCGMTHRTKRLQSVPKCCLQT